PRRRRRDRLPRPAGRPGRHGPRGPALGPRGQGLPAPARHVLLAALARQRRPGAHLDGEPRPPDRGGRPAAHRHRRPRDVRRALRHPRARRARVHLVVRRRRGLPRRLLLPPRARADLLLLAGRPGVPDLPPPRRPAGHRQRRALGGAQPRSPGTRRAEPGSAHLRARGRGGGRV
ncbi:MAG: Trehalose utilization protein ThuA, partial [uncultured Thermoleophilia bacterium]